MAGGGYPYNIIVYHKNGSNTYKMYGEFDYSPYGITYGELLDCVKNNQSYSTSTILNIVGTGTASGDEIGLSTSDGGTAIDLTSYIPAASKVTTLPDLILYALYSEPETITGFYLDGTEYKFSGEKYTAGEGINVTSNNAITNTGVLSVNGETGNVTIAAGLQVAPNSPITGIKYVWYGTEAQYAALTQYYTDVEGDTEFHTF